MQRTTRQPKHKRKIFPCRRKEGLLEKYLRVFGDFDGLPERPSSQSPLESIPFEIFLLIVEFLNIAALADLWSAVPCLRIRICQHPVFQTISFETNYQNALSGLLLAGTARKFTLAEFLVTLKSTDCMLCTKCNGKATLLSLLYCQRVCRPCIEQSQDFLPLITHFAEAIFGFDPIEEEQIPVARLELVSPTCSSHVPQWHNVAALSSVARVAAGKQDVLVDPKGWAEVLRQSVQEHLAEHYSDDRLHSHCSGEEGCLVYGEFNLEPNTGIPAKIRGLYTAMTLH